MEIILIRVDSGIVTVVGGTPGLRVVILDNDVKDWSNEIIEETQRMNKEEIVNYINKELKK